jgi:hypothetical protein
MGRLAFAMSAVPLMSAAMPVPLPPPGDLQGHAGVGGHEALGPALGEDDHGVRALDG